MEATPLFHARLDGAAAGSAGAGEGSAAVPMLQADVALATEALDRPYSRRRRAERLRAGWRPKPPLPTNKNKAPRGLKSISRKLLSESARRRTILLSLSLPLSAPVATR